MLMDFYFYFLVGPLVVWCMYVCIVVATRGADVAAAGALPTLVMHVGELFFLSFFLSFTENL